MNSSALTFAGPNAAPSAVWQPIETAPRDGTAIWLHRAELGDVNGYGPVIGAYDVRADLPWRFVETFDWRIGEEDEEADPFNAFLRGYEPTHWAELIPPKPTPADGATSDEAKVREPNPSNKAGA